MSCRIRVIKHRKFEAGLARAHPILQDRISLNCTRIKNAHRVHKKTLKSFVMYGGPKNFPFSFFPAKTLPNT